MVVAVILYAIQIYADFSGCMDIVIGASKMYWSKPSENFNSPFSQKIYLNFGEDGIYLLEQWGKDNIMYPLLKAKYFSKNR